MTIEEIQKTATPEQREAARSARGVGNIEAPAGTVFVCSACGKLSRDRYGDKKISHGWDASCMLHAVLCFEDMRSTINSGYVAVPVSD